MTSDTLVAPYSGTLVIRYDSANALDSEINANADLTVTNNGQSLEVDTVVNHLGPSIQSTYFCTQPSTVFGDWFRYYPGQGAQDSVWTVGQVTEGDKIAFDYDGKRVGYTYLTGATSDSTWVGGAEGCYDLPVFYYEDAVWITAMVDQDTLDIQIDDPKEVWPSIKSGKYGGAPSTFDFGLVNDSIDVTVTMEDSGTPIQNTEVHITSAWVYGSGGHSHSDPPFPTGWIKFKDLDNPGTARYDTISVTTDTNGQANVRFFAPPWGGRISIGAAATYNSKALSDTDTLTVRVPDLVRLADSPRLGSIVLVGGRCEHHGPGGTGVCATPDDNHYTLHATIETLINIDSAWAAEAPPSEPGSSAQAPFRVNDMSLPLGGKFDVFGNWLPLSNHQFHRVGRDADIRTQRSGLSRIGIYVRNVDVRNADDMVETKRKSPEFDELVRRYGAEARVHGKKKDYSDEHYHLYFY